MIGVWDLRFSVNSSVVIISFSILKMKNGMQTLHFFQSQVTIRAFFSFKLNFRLFDKLYKLFTSFVFSIDVIELWARSVCNHLSSSF